MKKTHRAQMAGAVPESAPGGMNRRYPDSSDTVSEGEVTT